MPIRRWNKYIENLREQPEHVRLRHASLLTGGAGIVIAIGWLTVLLPLQLWLTQPRESGPGIAQQVREALPAQSGQVGGVQDTAPAAPDPVSETQLFHGTRPTLRHDASPDDVASAEPTATPETEEENEEESTPEPPVEEAVIAQ